MRSCGKPAPPPLFDERFAGYGKNKLDWISSLRDANFTFLAAKRAWIAHAPHAASDAKRKWASERRPGARGATGARRRKDLMFGERDAAATAMAGAAQESEIPNFKGSFLGRFPLVSDDFWTSLGTVSKRGCFSWNARARNTHVEATLDHSFAAQATATPRCGGESTFRYYEHPKIAWASVAATPKNCLESAAYCAAQAGRDADIWARAREKDAAARSRGGGGA